MRETNPMARVSGGIISEVGTINIAVSAGDWWEGLTNFTTAAVDTSAAGEFLYYYDDNAGSFTEVTAQTDIDATQYDDGSGSLATLTNNKYGVHWVYLGQDGDIYVVYGLGDYTITEAQDAGLLTNLPHHFAENHAILIAKIIIQKSASVFTSIESAFTSVFAAGVSSSNFCTAAEINTGTEAGKSVTPDALAGSNLGIRYFQLPVIEWTTDHTTGDGKFYFNVPAGLAGMNIVSVRANVITAGVTGTCDIQLRNVTQAADILSTKITIDTTETSSETAATPACY